MKTHIKRPKPMLFFLPATFLLVLGVGNVTLGTYKGREYESIVQTLAKQSSNQGLTPPSALERIQLTKQTTGRLYQRQKKARARVDFYNLVTGGGKAFLLISIPFFALALLIKLRNNV